MVRDRDLISIQEARELATRAAEAQHRFAGSSQAQVDAVVAACAAAATEAGPELARLAVEETGYGNVPDKIIKNRLASVIVHEAIRDMKTVGVIREDREKGILEVATPVGVVAAIIPSTNPTSTTIYKTLISLKARNAIVMSPHPSAVKCIRATTEVLARAALRAGAPDGLISCMEHATMQGTQELWKHREVGVILATGGAGLVRAAYASGKPAYGVGPGNVPAYIERTANVPKAVADIFAGKTFDYGTICSSEQAIVCDQAIADQVLEECRRQGGHLLSADEISKLGALVFRPGSHTPNPQIVGKPATTIAEMAGISVAPRTRVLIARLEGVGKDYPLSAEKLSPILAFYVVANAGEAMDLCSRLLRFGGAGHTAAVHTQTESVAREFGKHVPAFRVCVNTAAVHGSIGYSTNLFPAMTLGCGAVGGNITSDNIGPQHLMNIKRIAWESRPVEHRTIPADRRMLAEVKPEDALTAAAAPPVAAAEAGARVPELPDRATIAAAVSQVMQSLGIPRNIAAQGMAPVTGAAAPAATSAPASGSDAVVKTSVLASPAAEIVERVFSRRAAPSPPAPEPTAPRNPASAAPKEEPSAGGGSREGAPTLKIAEFVSEADVRSAMRKGEKIFIGPKTIVTPAAWDLGSAHEIFVETAPRP